MAAHRPDLHPRCSTASRRGMVRRTAITSVVVASLAVLTACNSGGGPKVASIGGAAANPSASSAPLSAADREAALRKFAACMRTNGVKDFPDPIVDSNGNARLGGTRGLERNSPSAQKAFTACRPLLASLRQSFTPENRQQFQDALLAYAACMRSNGYQIADPTFGAPPTAGARGRGPFGDVNRNDPVFKKADAICRPKTLSGLPGGGPGGGGFRGA